MLEESYHDEMSVHRRRRQALERASRVRDVVDGYRHALRPQFRESHVALGLYYLRHGLLTKAADEFRIVVDQEHNFLAYFNFGHILAELGRHEDALEAFEHCLRLSADDPATHFEIAAIAFSRSDYQHAIDHLQIALHSYPDDTDLLAMIALCHLRLGQYQAARRTLEQALQIAGNQASDELQRLLATVDRFDSVGPKHSFKDRLYAEHGVFYLGSAQDDGIHVQELDDYHFTYPDIAVTVQRFLGLVQASDWNLTCVVALDRLGQPLAKALAHLLHLDLRTIHMVRPTDRPLLTLAVGHEAELLDVGLERLAVPTISFGLGLNWMRRHNRLPNVSGIITREACSVPWESELRRLRSEGATNDHIEHCLQAAANHIIQTTLNIPPDRNLADQIAYYRHLELARSTPLPHPKATFAR
jgi:tetratricopeptide (TPR) repeat protein